MKFLILIGLIYNIYPVLLLKEEKICRVLCLEGGGTKGAFQAGALKGMHEAGANIDYDIVSGISVGAINGVAVAMFPRGDEDRMVKMMESMWNDVRAHNFFKNWFFGAGEGLMMERGVFDNSPMYQFLTDKLAEIGSKIPQRYISIGITEANEGIFFTITEEKLQSIKDIVNWIVRSASMPGVFPYVVEESEGKTKVYVDGGSIVNLDVPTPVERCKEIYGNDTNVQIDVIVTNVQKNQKEFQDLLGSTSDLYHAQIAYPNGMNNIHWNYVVAPKKPLSTTLITLDFKHEDMMAQFEIGYKRGLEIVKEGFTGNKIHQMAKDWRNQAIYGTTQPDLAHARSTPTTSDDNVVNLDL